MATAAGNEYEDTIDQCDSLTKESDEIQEMFCEQCEKELGTIVTADGFCVECVEYLCSTCIRYHKKYKRYHILQGSANMPQDFCFEKCQIHTEELIKFYCDSCEKSACATCRAEMHNGCTIKHIPTLLKYFDIKKEARQIQLSIDQDLAEMATSKDNVSAKLKKVYSNKRHASASIKQHKESLLGNVEDLYIEHLNHLEAKLERGMQYNEQRRVHLLVQLDKEREELYGNHLFEKKKLQDEIRLTKQQIEREEDYFNTETEKLKQTDEKKLQTVLSNSNETEVDLTELKGALTKKMQQGQKSGLFLAMNKVKHDFEKLKSYTNRVNYDTEIKNYKFQSGKDRVKLKPRTNINFGSLAEKSEIKEKMQLIPVKSDKDKTDSKITGFCKLTYRYSNLVVAADKNNASIKLIHTRTKTISSVFHLKSKPFDVTEVDNNKIAVTLPDAGKIQFLFFNGADFSLGHEISVKTTCHGIVYNKPNLIVTFTKYPGDVQILEMNGTLLKTLKKGPFGHIGVSPTNNMIYTQEKDFTTSSLPYITKLSMDGKLLFREKMPVCPGIAIGKQETIYMCNLNGSAIIQFSADLKKKHELHLQPENHIKMPCSLFYCNMENELYVGTEGGDIHVLKIEQQLSL